MHQTLLIDCFFVFLFLLQTDQFIQKKGGNNLKSLWEYEIPDRLMFARTKVAWRIIHMSEHRS